MGTRVGEGANWQAEPAFGEGSRQEGTSVIRFPFEAVYLDFDANAVDAHRTESLSLQNQGVESDECYCGEGSQTPRHILMQCPLYADLRQTFLDKIRMTDLGDSTDYDAIVSHSQATRYVAEFMLQTGLLGQFRHVEMEPEPPEGGNDNDLPGRSGNGTGGEDAG
jgi:hypothetical protein